MYKINIKDRYDNYIELQAEQGESLFSALGKYQPPLFQGNCGGRGQCQACRVFVQEFDEYRKSCETTVEQDLHIILPFAIGENSVPKTLSDMLDENHTYGIAVDIGTTSIGMRLLDLNTKTAVCEYTMYNPQAVYGADVISRIAYVGGLVKKTCTSPEAANLRYDSPKTPAVKMQLLIWEHLFTGIDKMLSAVKVERKQLVHMAVAANTTMVYLLMGYHTGELGSYPFRAGHLQEIHGTVAELLPDITDISHAFYPEHLTLDIYPGFSAFVGADIVSGAVFLQLGKKEKYDLLIDLGTNGEILLINANQGFCGATSCGSAFDGYVTSKAYSTDVLSRMMLLRKRGIIHKDGSLMERYVKAGYTFADGITIAQEDIRNIQKAKAAIRTGIDLLLCRAEVLFSDCRIYVAGNFGFHLELSAAFDAGMFPVAAAEKLQGNISVVGNSALSGAEYLLLHREQALEQARCMAGRCKVLEFANQSSFSKQYINALDFE